MCCDEQGHPPGTKGRQQGRQFERGGPCCLTCAKHAAFSVGLKASWRSHLPLLFPPTTIRLPHLRLGLLSHFGASRPARGPTTPGCSGNALEDRSAERLDLAGQVPAPERAKSTRAAVRRSDGARRSAPGTCSREGASPRPSATG